MNTFLVIGAYRDSNSLFFYVIIMNFIMVIYMIVIDKYVGLFCAFATHVCLIILYIENVFHTADSGNFQFTSHWYRENMTF